MTGDEWQARERLRKTLALLASDKDGEVLAAVAAAKRLMGRFDWTWDSFVSAMIGNGELRETAIRQNALIAELRAKIAKLEGELAAARQAPGQGLHFDIAATMAMQEKMQRHASAYGMGAEAMQNAYAPQKPRPGRYSDNSIENARAYESWRMFAVRVHSLLGADAPAGLDSLLRVVEMTGRVGLSEYQAIRAYWLDKAGSGAEVAIPPAPRP